VGDRHLLAALAPELKNLGVRSDLILEELASVEIRAGFTPKEIPGRWHGLLETRGAER
jgi:hypothetical protein